VRSVVVVFGLSTLAATVQEPPGIRFPVETQIVYVEVVVTDKRGRPVSGLEESSFALYEDRRPVPIAAFRAPATAGAPRGTEPAVPRAPAPAATGPGEPVTFVVYFDNWNLTPPARARVVPGLATFLKEQLARGGARVLLVSALDQTRILSPLTTHAEDVAGALRSLEREPTHGHVTRSDERQAIDAVRAFRRLSSGTSRRFWRRCRNTTSPVPFAPWPHARTPAA
jgi:VWFA-related protein